MSAINAPQNNQPIGYVIDGGLKANLRVRLTVPPTTTQEGSFIVIKSGNWQFYGIATDLQLGAIDPRYADNSSSQRFPADIAAPTALSAPPPVNGKPNLLSRTPVEVCW